MQSNYYKWYGFTGTLPGTCCSGSVNAPDPAIVNNLSVLQDAQIIGNLDVGDCLSGIGSNPLKVCSDLNMDSNDITNVDTLTTETINSTNADSVFLNASNATMTSATVTNGTVTNLTSTTVTAGAVNTNSIDALNQNGGKAYLIPPSTVSLGPEGEGIISVDGIRWQYDYNGVLIPPVVRVHPQSNIQLRPNTTYLVTLDIRGYRAGGDPGVAAGTASIRLHDGVNPPADLTRDRIRLALNINDFTSTCTRILRTNSNGGQAIDGYFVNGNSSPGPSFVIDYAELTAVQIN